MGKRIVEAVDAAIDAACNRNHLVRDGLFFSSANQTQVPIRNRENVRSANLRKPDYLPPQELRAAILLVVQKYFGMSRDEAAVQVARLLGFKSTTAALRKMIDEEISFLLVEQLLEEKNGRTYVSNRAASLPVQ
jgi:septum formation topological specificity factor MinE